MHIVTIGTAAAVLEQSRGGGSPERGDAAGAAVRAQHSRQEGCLPGTAAVVVWAVAAAYDFFSFVLL